MQAPRTVIVGAAALALVLGGAGCAKAAEKVAEKAVEQATGCEDVDTNDDGASIECDGDTFDISGSGNAELPEGWPEGLELPAGAGVHSSTSSTDPPGAYVSASVDGDVAAVHEEVKGQLTSAGFAIESDSLTDAGAGGQTGVISASDGSEEVTVSVTANPDATGELGSVVLGYTVTEAQG